MTLSVNSVQLPYVRFELRAVEDRDQTMKLGRVVYKDVAYAIVTPSGSRDETEKIAEEWLAELRRQSQQDGREYLGQWAEGFTRSYENWKKGNEIPESGTPIRMCLMFRPAEIQAILGANVRTLEDLAVANEEALGRMGIGGRDLKARAVEWMRTNQNVSSVSEELTALKNRMLALEEELKEKDKTIGQLSAKIVRKAA